MTAIYHITHIQNLRSIIREGGLWCDRERLSRGLTTIGIAHAHIKERRARKAVEVAARGTLADYVPFMFCPRSPMLYAIHQGSVEGYDGGQGRVVHLVSSVESACGLGAPWCFTDGHADMGISRFFADWTASDQIDWDVVEGRWWNDTRTNNDRKRRKQAEFLVHRFFPWTAMDRIGVVDSSAATSVEEALEGAEHSPPIQEEPSWYY